MLLLAVPRCSHCLKIISCLDQLTPLYLVQPLYGVSPGNHCSTNHDRKMCEKEENLTNASSTLWAVCRDSIRAEERFPTHVHRQHVLPDTQPMEVCTFSLDLHSVDYHKLLQ